MELASLISSSAVPVTVDSRLRVQVWNATSSDITAELTTRQLDNKGQLVETPSQITISANAAGDIVYQQLTEGQLTNVTLRALVSGVQSGFMFATIGLQQGAVVDPARIIILTSGEATTAKPLNFPEQRPVASEDVTGTIKTTQHGDPDPHTNFDLTFNTTATIELLSGTFNLTTDATAASRKIYASFIIDGVQAYRIYANIRQDASLTRHYTITNEIPFYDSTADQRYIVIPKGIIGRVAQLIIGVDDIQASDQIDTITISYRQKVFTAQ